MMKAYATGGSGASAYQRAVARQYQSQYGGSLAAAQRAVSTIANGRTPFQPSRGRNASPASVRNQAGRLRG